MKHKLLKRETVPPVPAWATAKWLMCCICLLAARPGFGQAQADEGWTLHSTQNGVSIYYRYDKCEQQDVVLIKLYNTTKSAVAVSWKEKFILRGKEINVNDSQAKTLVLPVGEALAGDCSLADKPAELVTPAFQYVTLLRKGITSFEIYDFEITSK